MLFKRKIYYFTSVSILSILNLYFMETKKERTLKKIQLIEEPKSEELLRKELEEALGGWNCGTYDDGWFSNTCNKYNSGGCTDGSGSNNYCVNYSF